MKLKACHISDTHDVYQDFSMLVEDGTEIVFITGDMTYQGSDWELVQLIVQMKKLKAKVRHVVVIAGNHERGCEKDEAKWRKAFADINIHFLIHESVEIEGIKIFGSPWTKWFYDWAYNIPIGYEEMKWSEIPDNTQILLTHGPRYMVLDKCPNGFVGDAMLGLRIEDLKHLRYHMFGHIHEGRGTHQKDRVFYSNASIMSGKYKFIHTANHFDIDLEVVSG